MLGAQRDFADGGEELAVLAGRGGLNDGGGRAGRETAGLQAARDRLEIFHAHVNAERRAELGVVFPANRGVGFVRILVAGEKHDGGTVGAVRERHAGIGRRGERGGDAGHDLERNAGVDERLGLLAAAAEDERIAALEADDGFALAREADERALDVALRAAEAAAFFPTKTLSASGRARARISGATRWS